MGRNLVLDSPEETLVTRIKSLERMVEDLKTNQPATFSITTLAGVSVTVAANTNVFATATASPVLGTQILMVIPEVSICKDSISAANLYPGGANWTALENYDFEVWMDWGSSDNHNMVCKIVFKNKSMSSVDLIIRIQFRYLTTGTMIGVS